jgi:hypothetical protein
MIQYINERGFHMNVLHRKHKYIPSGYGCIFISVLTIFVLIVLQKTVVSLLVDDVNAPLRLESRQFSNHHPPG